MRRWRWGFRVLIGVLPLILMAGSAFAEAGVNGWAWEEDGYGNFTFSKKAPNSPLFVVTYEGGYLWSWGLIGESDWNQAGETHRYQLGNDPPQKGNFSTFGNWMYQKIGEWPEEVAQFLTYSSVTIWIEGHEYRWELSDLAETIELAGEAMEAMK